MLFLVKCANIALRCNCLWFSLYLFLFAISFMKGVINFSFLKNWHGNKKEKRIREETKRDFVPFGPEVCKHPCRVLFIYRVLSFSFWAMTGYEIEKQQRRNRKLDHAPFRPVTWGIVLKELCKTGSTFLVPLRFILPVIFNCIIDV